MQSHYFELRAIPQVELTEMHVMNQFMQSVHQVLIHYQGEIGISFPCYTEKQNKTLGGIIRFFGKKEELFTLSNDLKNQFSIKDYGILFDIKAIPEKIKGYLCVTRIRKKGQSNLRRAERRLSVRGQWSELVKEKMIEQWGITRLNCPHCHLKSSSTGQSFILWIHQKKCSSYKRGKFNSYGMSSINTVPDF